MRVIGADEVERLLPYETCIPLIRNAMIRFSADPVAQPLRNVVEVGSDRFFGVMPGRLNDTGFFGAKLVAVFPHGDGGDRQRHQGLVALFESERGAPVCIADAEAITSIRTAAATAVATEALAQPGARHLALFGCGLQAKAHLAALTSVRRYDRILVWGRSHERASRFAEEESARLGLQVSAVASAEEATRASDVICTLTSASAPILFGDWVADGAHVNLVGSSVLGPVEVDSALVAKARFFVDSRRSAIAQASELRVAIDSGLVDEGHVAGEIGDILSGRKPGRRTRRDITIYKSLGLVVQDLAAVRYLFECLMETRTSDLRQSADGVVAAAFAG